MARSVKMKANRNTFTGVLRVYINKFNIPDSEWFFNCWPWQAFRRGKRKLSQRKRHRGNRRL